MTKKAAGTFFSFRMLRICGVQRGSGPSSKVMASFFAAAADLIDVVGERKCFVIFVGEEIGRGVVEEAAPAGFGSVDEAPHVAVAFEDQVRSGRNVGEFLTQRRRRGAWRPRCARWKCRSGRRQNSMCPARPGARWRAAGCSRHGVEHPDPVNVIVFVDVGVVRIQRSVVEIDVGFRFEGVQQRFLHAELGGGPGSFLVPFRAQS